MRTFIVIIIGLLLVFFLVWVGVKAGLLKGGIFNSNESKEPVACTEEAKLCSDGSYVGRSGPNCEFDACPKEDLIIIENPRANEIILSPLLVKGKTRGTWFFEASFPVRLLDGNGKQIAITVAQAKGEWMTENFVPFEATIIFQTPETEKGTLVLEKDNPSGLPENADELRIPILFNILKQEVKGCRKTGCSGQVCSDKDVITTCEFLPEYACYQAARCEKQTNGNCGWTMTQELKDCLERYK